MPDTHPAATVHVRPSYPRVVIGLAVIAAGLVFTLDNFGVLHIEDWDTLVRLFWPILFLAVGGTGMLQSRSLMGCCASLVWVVIGLWLLGENFGLIQYSVWALWPAFLVVLGGWIILNGFRLRGTDAQGAADSASVVNALALMSGVSRRTNTQDFRGGELMAFMGGGKIDLRDAAIASGQAQINVITMWGGLEITVPETWTVDVRVFPFMGGVDDRTTAPGPDSHQRLVVRGLVVMGGIGIKNPARS